jgi:hypothetical protein
VVALIVNTAAAAGSRKAMFTAVGTNWASLVLIGAAAWIILTSAAIDKAWLNGMSLLGCLFIGYIAVGTLREALQAPTQEAASEAPAAGAAGCCKGSWSVFPTPRTSSSSSLLPPVHPDHRVVRQKHGGAVTAVGGHRFRRAQPVHLRHRQDRLAAQQPPDQPGFGVALLLIAAGGLAYNLKELAA